MVVSASLTVELSIDSKRFAEFPAKRQTERVGGREDLAGSGHALAHRAHDASARRLDDPGGQYVTAAGLLDAAADEGLDTFTLRDLAGYALGQDLGVGLAHPDERVVDALRRQHVHVP